jgi:hypothetical protein
VLALFGLEKVAGAGPLTCDHCAVTVEPAGCPSSVMVPVRFTTFAGSVRLTLSAVTLIAGDWFGVGAARTVIVTFAETVNSESVAVNCSVYVPGVVKVACVTACVGAEKVTGAGPLKLLHCCVTVLPIGNPSSVTVPFKVTELCGNWMVWFGPVVTWGALFTGDKTVTVVSLNAVCWLLLAVNRNT